MPQLASHPASSTLCCCNAPNNIVVVHLLEQRDLSNGGTRDSLVLGFESDLLQCDNLIRLLVAGTVLQPVMKSEGQRGRSAGTRLETGWRVLRCNL